MECHWRSVLYVRMQLLLFATDDRIILVCRSEQLENRLSRVILIHYEESNRS